jgi:hypothetical protein
MSVRFCPKCTSAREMNISRVSRVETGADGKTKSIETTSYHCARCFSFVASDDREVPSEPADDGDTKVA